MEGRGWDGIQSQFSGGEEGVGKGYLLRAGFHSRKLRYEMQ